MNSEQKVRHLILSFLKRLLLSLLVLSPILLYLGSSMIIEAQSPLQKNPWVHWNGIDPHTEAYISWETESKVDSTVEYGFEKENLYLSKEFSAQTFMHRVKLEGLPANKKIFYRAKSSEGRYISPIQSFKTAPETQPDYFKPFNVTFISDTQQLWGTGHFDTITKAIDEYVDTEFLGIAGDVGQTEDDQDTWNFFWKHANKVSDTLPIITVPGNHDDPDNNESLYLKYFGNTTNQMDCYYAFNWSNVQFTMMEIANMGDRNPYEAEDNLRAYTWLNETLKKGLKQKYRVLVFHRQIFSSLGNDETLLKYLKPIIEEYNVSLTLYGHKHGYERFYSEGFNYICLGGGGGLQNSYMKPQKITQSAAMGASFTKLFFDSESITIKTLSPSYDIIDQIRLNYENGMMRPETITPYGNESPEVAF